MLFRRFRKIEPNLDPVIEKLLEELAQHDPHTREYSTAFEQLERVYKLRKKKWQVSPDTVILAAANLIGIGIIVLVERKDIITSKGLPFVGRINAQQRGSS